MRINRVRFTNGDMQINVYTNQIKDLKLISNILMRAKIKPAERKIFPPKPFKIAVQFIFDNAQTSEFAKAIGGHFGESGRFTSNEKSDDNNYACREVTDVGSGKGCENISAPDKPEAIIQCAMVADDRNWVGGDAIEGSCS